MAAKSVNTKTSGTLRVKTEPPDSHEMKNFAETTMNELLAWYGYDKVDEQDTEQLKLPQFAAKEDAANSSRRTSTSQPSSDAGDSNHGDSKSPGENSSELAAQHKALVSALNQGSESSTPTGEKTAGGKTGEVIICGWCQKTGLKLFTLKTSTATKVFCSEVCFTQCRRASFKKNKVCDWCKHVRHTVNYVDFQDGENQLQFCSQKCLNQYKMNIFCRETQEHLHQIKGSDPSVPGPSSDKQILITPELWMQQNASEFAAAKLKIEAKAAEDDDAGSGRESSSVEPMAIEVKPIENKTAEERINSSGERRSIGLRTDGMERAHASRELHYSSGRMKNRRSRSRDSLPVSAATSPGSSHVSSSPNTRVNPTPPTMGSAAPEPRALLGGLGGFPGPPLMYPGLLPGAMPGLLPPGMLMPEPHTAGRGGATPEGSNTPRPLGSNNTPSNPYLLPPFPPGAGFMPPPPPGLLPGMGFPMPPLHAGLLGAPPPTGLLPPNTLLAPYPVLLPIPVPVPIVIPVKTDKEVTEILNMYKSKKTNVKKEGDTAAFPESSSSSTHHGHQSWTCTNVSGRDASPQPERECHSASHDSVSSSEMGCHGNRIACACCQLQKTPVSGDVSPGPHWSQERPHSTSYLLNGSEASSRDCDMEGEVIDLSKDKPSTYSPSGPHILDKHKTYCSEHPRERPSFSGEPQRMSSPRDPGTITIVPTAPGGLGEHPDPALIPILPMFMRPGQTPTSLPNGGHLLPPRDHSYSSRRNLILDAPGGRREHSSSPPPEKRILLRSPSREAQFKRRCMRRSIKSK